MLKRMGMVESCHPESSPTAERGIGSLKRFFRSSSSDALAKSITINQRQW